MRYLLISSFMFLLSLYIKTCSNLILKDRITKYIVYVVLFSNRVNSISYYIIYNNKNVNKISYLFVKKNININIKEQDLYNIYSIYIDSTLNPFHFGEPKNKQVFEI